MSFVAEDIRVADGNWPPRAVLPQAAVLAFPFTVLEVVRIGLQAGTARQLAETFAPPETARKCARRGGGGVCDWRHRAAVQLVQGAGPFPAPPADAQRQFTIQIEGR